MRSPREDGAELERYDYGRVAFCYDELAAMYSLGRIARSKRAFLDSVSAGDRVLVAGAGRGDDALAAARLGAKVTAVDRSEAMLRRLGAAAEGEGLVIERIEANAADPSVLAGPAYDHVVAHYFLNCFAEREAAAMLGALARRVAPSGRLHLADFAPAEEGLVSSVLTAVYYRSVNLAGWVLGLCALHPIPDLPALLEAEGFETERVCRFPIGPGPAPAYWSVSGRAPARDPDPSTERRGFT